jgi:cytoskeletal protein RodZ
MTPNDVPKSSSNFLTEKSIDWNAPVVRRQIGQALKRKRDAEAMSIGQAARLVGISDLHLEALEKGAWDQLPFESAGRMWAEKYAGIVKLDLTGFERTRVRLNQVILLVIIVLLILAGLILLIIGQLGSPPELLNITTDLNQVFEDSSFSVEGHGEPGYQVEMLVGGTIVASTTVGADGNWSMAATLEPGPNEITFGLSGTGSATPISAAAAVISVATPTSTIRPRPTVEMMPTATDTVEPTSTNTSAPELTATPQPLTSTPNPKIDDFDSTQASGTAFGPNRPYLLAISVDDRQKVLRVEMRTKSVPPNLVDDINIYIVDELKREEIFEKDIEPQNANIDAGVIQVGSEGRVIEVKVNPPVPDVYLVVFNRSEVSTDYNLKIFNGRFR